MTKRLAIIPARGGSKRIPNKNIRDFCGKPVIGYSLEAARQSGLFDAIHVSTDDQEISRIVSDMGFPPEFSRPGNLADDHTPLMPVLKYVAQRYGEMGREFDQIWLLMACAPMIDETDLAAASALFDEHEGNRPVIMVGAYSSPIERAYKRSSNGEMTPVQAQAFATRTQDLEKNYYDAGMAYVFSARRVLDSQGAGDNQGFIGHVIPAYKAVDIDDEDDWVLAEAIYRGLSTQ